MSDTTIYSPTKYRVIDGRRQWSYNSDVLWADEADLVADNFSVCPLCHDTGEVYERTTSSAARPSCDIEGPFPCPRGCEGG